MRHFLLAIRNMRLGGVASLLLFSSFALPVLAQAPPSADTFVTGTFAKTNFGPSITLAVGQNTITLVQFNLSGIPAGATVSKASMRLFVDAIGAAGKFDVYQVTSGWSESSVTYNTRPTIGSSASQNGPFTVNASSVNQFILVDVTPLVQGWLNGTIANNGVAIQLTSGSNGIFSFDSKESLLTGNGPQLEIAFAGTPGPPGPQGIQGLQGAPGAQGVKGDTGATGAQGPAGPQGPQGTQGAQGPQGPAGPQGQPGVPGIDGVPGPQGLQGPQGVAGTGFKWRGQFVCDGTTIYAAGDVVSYQGSSWINNSYPIGGCVQPPFAPWELLAQQGSAGAQGPAGPIGPQGLPGAPGIGLTGPQGQQGPPGPVGLQGPQGPAGPAGAGGFNGMQEFTNPNDVPVSPYVWTVPAGVTRVMVEAWGGGGGPDIPDGYGGGGGGYIRDFLPVTPGATYSILVGGGGVTGQNGNSTTILSGSQTLLTAYPGEPGVGSWAFGSSVGTGPVITRDGADPTTFIGNGGLAGNAYGCPGPKGSLTGAGGSYPSGQGYPGYVLITW